MSSVVGSVKVKLSDFPEHVQKRLIKDNPGVFNPVGGLQNPKPESNSGGTDAGTVRRQARRKIGMAGGSGQGRVLVTIVSYRRKLLDGDNLQGGAKSLRDAIADTIGMDDADPRLKFEYAQVITTGKCGTAVKIDVTSPASSPSK